MNGIYKLMLQLLYGCGLRLNELLNLRIKDIDFGFDNVYIFDSKSQKDRVVPLPQKIKEDLKIHIKEIRKIHQDDLLKGFGKIMRFHVLASTFIFHHRGGKTFIHKIRFLRIDLLVGWIFYYS